MSDDLNSAQTFDRFAAFYDDDYRDYDDDLGAILELAEEQRGKVLELGCGTGRVVLPLAQLGLQVTGVDVSEALLDVARRKVTAAGQEQRVTLLRQDLRALEVPGESFALAVCTSNTLMHFTAPGDQLTVLRNAFSHLQPGGKLLLDLFNPDLARLMEVAGVMELADRWQDATTGAQVIKWSVRNVDIAEQVQETLFVYEEVLPTGETRRTLCPFALRYIWRNEGELMLRAAGFDVDEVWGDFYGSPYDNQSDHLIFIAARPA